MKLPAVLAGLALVLPSVVAQAQRVVGYYGKTAGCPDYPSFAPAQLPYDLYTHLNFAFVLINDDGVVAMQHTGDEQLYKELNDLKLKKPSLRTTVTVGGWDMDMAHYSKMVSTQANRQKFITSAIAYIRKYNFDGIDFDWEYPSDNLRGGHENDPENFVAFLREFREAANSESLKENQERLILSIALPGGPYHGQHFMIPKLAQYVDWFNIMAYNLHGQWENMVFCAAPLYDTAANTQYNGYSVDDAVKSMAPKSVDPQKFNLGLSLSGVTFTLKDKSKTTPGSPAIGPGKEGCQEKGAMAYFETQKLSNNLQIADVKARLPDQFLREVTQEPRMDDIGKCMYMVVNQDQWIGYDTPETFKLKIDYLKKVGFGGVSIWSMDSDSASHELTKSIHDSLSQNFVQGESLPGNSSSSEEPHDIVSQVDRKKKNKNESVSANAGTRDSSVKQIVGFAVKMMAVVAISIVLLA
ncbi:Endochitinase 1 [Mortierella claussenii]|nr:Endochitinase 1 [Mortierella claussenii]